MITNTTGLPLPLLAAVESAPYTRGGADISATSLLQPPRKLALEELYADRLSEDLSQMGAVVGGNAFHAYAKGPGEFDDKRRLFIRVAGWTVSGQTDHVIGKKIVDYKSCRTSKVTAQLFDDWEAQLNTYAELRRANGYAVDELEICAWLKDWSVEIADRSGEEYPSGDIVRIPIPLWDQARAQAYILERVLLHQAARVELPDCPEEELWKGKEWAVVKGAATKAYRLYTTEGEATTKAEEMNQAGGDYFVRFTPQEPRRCRFYCAVGRHGLCSQYEAMKSNEGVR